MPKIRSITSLINTLLALASIMTATGILVHDTRIDGLSASLLSVPSMMTSTNNDVLSNRLVSDLHIHTERVSLSDSMRSALDGDPSIQPRSDMKKYVQHKAAHGSPLFGTSPLFA